MQYTTTASTPLGPILLAADAQGLTGLWFEGQKHFARTLDSAHQPGSLPVFDETQRWLERYFAGREPGRTPPLHLMGTPFQLEVWACLRDIPYGRTTTYGALAAVLAERRGVAHLSAQAVGGAVGRNPISILVPCHRVLGADGSLTGYAGGVERKAALLGMEGVRPR